MPVVRLALMPPSVNERTVALIASSFIAANILLGTILAGSGNDWIDNRASGALSDEIRTGAGDDVIYGGDGADTLIGGSGNDTIDGGADGDYIDAGEGDDVITDIQAEASYKNNGTILAGSGNDSISASIKYAYSNLVIDGGEGVDSLSLTMETSTAEDYGSLS